MDKRTFVRRSFAAIAESYDLLNTLLSFGIDMWWRHEAIKALGFSGQGLVLDACAGTMRLGKGILRRYPGARVVTLDFSLVMLGRGAERAQGAAIAPIGGDAELLPFRAETFGRAIVGFGIRNLSDPRKGIEELARVLKKGGRVVILEFGRPTLPVFKNLYKWYLSRFIPWAGGVVSGQKEVYRYLHESIMAFPEPAELMAMMQKAGFSQIHCQKLTGGIANLYIGEKTSH
ncbi:MAG: ubiquinone/menaquinone biosynthesis methyltransferase [Deltaproteobacteria bacterium]|nr:ubiquinone/menaquinone biosynthesis methyltransferase [Deltaproteobacteria bacterium]